MCRETHVFISYAWLGDTRRIPITRTIRESLSRPSFQELSLFISLCINFLFFLLLSYIHFLFASHTLLEKSSSWISKKRGAIATLGYPRSSLVIIFTVRKWRRIRIGCKTISVSKCRLCMRHTVLFRSWFVRVRSKVEFIPVRIEFLVQLMSLRK